MKNLIIKDYIASGKKKNSKEVLQAIQELSHDELMRPQLIARILGYEDFDNYDEVGVYTKGYRILNKIPRMPSSIVENLVKSFKSFQHILDADIPKLDEVEGIGEIRADVNGVNLVLLLRENVDRFQIVFDGFGYGHSQNHLHAPTARDARAQLYQLHYNIIPKFKQRESKKFGLFFCARAIDKSVSRC